MRKTMRIFVSLLSLVFVMSLFPANVALADSKCGNNLTWKVSGNTLTISGSGDMYNYNTYDYFAPWSNYKYDIENLPELK